jgi:hypothetical protein
MEVLRPNLWITDDSKSENCSNTDGENESIGCFGVKRIGTRMGVVHCCRTFPGREQAEEVEGPNCDNHPFFEKPDIIIHSAASDDGRLHNQTSITLPYTTHATLH